MPGQPGGSTRVRRSNDTYLPLPEDPDSERRDESCKGKLLVALEDLVLDALESFDVSGREWREDERGGVSSAQRLVHRPQLRGEDVSQCASSEKTRPSREGGRTSRWHLVEQKRATLHPLHRQRPRWSQKVQGPIGCVVMAS